jgi:hypothetical protein
MTFIYNIKILLFCLLNIMATTKKMRKTRRNRSIKKRGGGGVWGWFGSTPQVVPKTDSDSDSGDSKCMLLKDYLELLVTESSEEHSEPLVENQDSKKQKFTYPYFQLPSNQQRNGNKYESFSICQVNSINKTEVKQIITTKLEYTLEYTQISYTTYKSTYKDENDEEQIKIQNQTQKFTRTIDSNQDIYKEKIRVYKTQPTDIQTEQTKPCDTTTSGGRTKRRRIHRKHKRKNSVRK